MTDLGRWAWSTKCADASRSSIASILRVFVRRRQPELGALLLDMTPDLPTRSPRHSLGGAVNTSGGARVTTVERSIEVEVPASTAYDQWMQFEEFPRFMSGVESVKRLDDKHLHWRAHIGVLTEEW